MRAINIVAFVSAGRRSTDPATRRPAKFLTSKQCPSTAGFRLLLCRMPRISALAQRKPKHFVGSRMETALH